MTEQARNAIRQAYRRDEQACLRELVAQTQFSASQLANVQASARDWISSLRSLNPTSAGLSSLLQEYDLSNEEGVILMCLAEALLRIPDAATADRLILDKLSKGHWDKHFHPEQGLWSNAATWGLVMTGRWLERIHQPEQSWLRLIARLGNNAVRQALRRSMATLAGQFVMGNSIAEAVERADTSVWQRYSFDCLGEAALTAEDAEGYFGSYLSAIETISNQGCPDDVMSAPGISVKLSALHPRYEYTRSVRLERELLPRVLMLARAAREAGIGLTLDAEEADRLEPSLDIFEAVLRQPDLAGWDGFGLAVQAYQKRARLVIDWLITLGNTLARVIPVRLVKGAYWDSEIKRAQERALNGYPVFTRKAATDVSYLACARQMLAASDVIYSQFATHNALTIASIIELGQDKLYEFQRLHGMGESLYSVVQQACSVPVRVYAPVGAHEQLLPYLVRRLLENGANSSFVNQLAQSSIPVEELLLDPVAELQRVECRPHPRIPLPVHIYQPQRVGGSTIDLSDPFDREVLLTQLAQVAEQDMPPVAEHVVINPATGETVGHLREADEAQLRTSLDAACRAAPGWDKTPVEERAACLLRAADLLESHRAELIDLIVREAGRCIPDAMNEVREAVDFCRYYAVQAQRDFVAHALPGPVGEANQMQLRGRGVFLCISPWNFPVAIFTGQVVAALVAGNAVLAKPARQTPLCGQRVVALLHEAGVPSAVLHLIAGPGPVVGDTLLPDVRLSGVALTGSTATARHIQQVLAQRDGPIVPLIAETGGQNVMLVDSSALPEQVVMDAMQSAFNSAGQRCSALRVLCVQEEIADRVISLLCGAMDELVMGDPRYLVTDVGPVIDAAAQANLQAHIDRMHREADVVKVLPAPLDARKGSFFPPHLIEINSLSQLQEEVFGPVLHVLRYRSQELEALIDQVNALGYGLTLGVHSRIESTWALVQQRARVGNLYVNRNMIGAVVGSQPFGGEGLSGTGPKAGGPFYLHRFTTERTVSINTAAVGGNASLLSLPEEDH